MYDVICADPPWPQRKAGRRSVRPNTSGVPLDYPVLAIPDIAAILDAVKERHASPRHVLFLWAIDRYLREAEQVLGDLGYRLHARVIWNKENGVAPAFTIRYSHEYLLYAYQGPLLPVDRSMRGRLTTVITERAIRHSQKPEASYQFIEALYPDARKLELFARRARHGWDVWGNEVESDVCIDLPRIQPALHTNPTDTQICPDLGLDMGCYNGL